MQAQEKSVIEKIVSLEFDSARYFANQMHDNDAFYEDLINLWEWSGQYENHKLRHIIKIDHDSKKAKEQLLLGLHYLFSGDRSRAMSYLLRADVRFREEENDLTIISNLSILFLNSRIIMSGEGYQNQLNQLAKNASSKDTKAWYHIHKLTFVEKIISLDSVERIWKSTFEEANSFFESNSINDNISAYFLTRKALYWRYYGNDELALKSFIKSIDYCADKPFLKHVKFLNLLDVAGLYLKKNERDSARNYLNLAKENWDNSDSTLSALNYHLILTSNYYEPVEQWDSAYFSLKKILNANLQKFFESNNVRISELSEEFEAEKRENEINSQKGQIETQNTWLIAITLFLMVSIGLAIGLVFSYQKIQSKNKKIETLMRELHHRVKNNLQVVSSLLGLQSMRLKDPVARKAVSEGKDRLRAMSLIHQKLYQNEDAISLNIKEYISNLVTELAQSYGYQNRTRFILDIPSIELDADNTLPLGLIVNELVSNTFKYAFKHVDEPELEIKLLQEGEKDFSFLLRDNGPGFPDGFDINQTNSFGTKLVSILVKQLNGTMIIDQENGLTYRINFHFK
jgi:two-component sensor histidine kinase